MSSIALYEKNDTGSTLVSNIFIDKFMTEANEAQIKIYLYLLRASSGDLEISVSTLADLFNYTEGDILRALQYWDRQGLLTIDFDPDKNIRGICLNDIHRVANRQRASVQSAPAPQDIPQTAEAVKPRIPADNEVSKASAAPADEAKGTRPFYSADKLDEFKSRDDVQGLLFMTEQYIGRPLSMSDISTILFIYDKLHFSVDLIEYLVEYCVNAGHKSMRYIEATAIAWDEQGIHDVKAARAETSTFKKDYYAVLRAFGLNGRNPVQADIDFIKRWKDEYGFDMDLIIEAVNRTMRSISKPSFSYADGILKNWKTKQVRKKSDLDALDADHAKSSVNAMRDKTPAPDRRDKFRNFEERSYDYDDLEKRFAKN
ncbi:DnaD and phage-associated domain-containing protein [Lachnospiraceae bacterium]|nr:DnaD and phage-associated domain-containing protein [Lachnospiraceae bacterium]